MSTLFRLVFLYLLLQTNSWAADFSTRWYSKTAGNAIHLNAELYLSSNCPYCQKADAFFREVEIKYPTLHVQRYFINQDKNALIHFNQLMTEQQTNDFSVPSIYFCNSRWTGFLSAQTTGKDLLNAMNYCQQHIKNKNQLTQSTINTLRELARASQLATVLSEEHSPRWVFTLVTSFIYAFIPCAYFGLAGFLAFLLIEEQRKKQFVAGFLYLSSVLIVYYVQQVASIEYVTLLPWLRIPALIVGLMTLYFVWFHKKKISTLYFILAFFLGLMVLFYQQMCSTSFLPVYQKWLDNQHLPNWQVGLYQFLYHSMSLVPFLLVSLVYACLMHIKRFAALRPKLVTMGLLFLFVIALCLIVYPRILSQFVFSGMILPILVICGYFLKTSKVRT